MSPLVTPPFASRGGTADDDALPELFATTDLGLTPGAYAELLASKHGSGDSIAVHVRLPFCPSRCLNCDHHTTVTHNSETIDEYIVGLEREISMVTDRIGRGLTLNQLHLGGGTPNYLSDTQLVQLMDVLDRHFHVTSDTETSLEANPKRCSPSQLTLLRGLGFRILDLQIRDLDSSVQLAIGRSHSLSVLEDVINSARSEGFETISMDLVYGLPNQSVESVHGTVANMINLNPDRIICQSFSPRPSVFKHQRALDAESLPSLADKVAMFNTASETLMGNGYEWVGLDCFALEHDALTRAKHAGHLHRNWVGYTDRDSGDLYGFGADAISQLREANVQNKVQLGEWHEAVQSGVLPLCTGERISESEQRQQAALSALLCNLELSDYGDLLEDNDLLKELASQGFVEISDDKVSVTEYGRFALHQRWSDASPHYRAARGIALAS
ncbi:radical SAM protein [Pseudohaliea rubra]|uniref:Coproporphyrinogen-III oxidase n=1 Tax=Pseudohaliea rubra DSM 19751 TaxID=1265313 RepID=A0A095XZL7_9GAMM|nr:radical SAM protein [Pseudohaliea rubra]KGE05211.1 Coproporphyrinogen III oxidase, oxygen-independent [Pseudohaliea rubra DSM 19751]